jgi:hypothetical protein
VPDTDGKSLESLVSMIERYLAPSEFTVETRKQVYENGVQIAELDIIITGRVGTSKFTGLIECRDRPSDGKAPGSWIEQLVGRKDRFKLSSVMAVSTTGFALGAIRYATEKGIELRTLDGLTYEAFQHWLPMYSPLLICDFQGLQSVRFFLKPDPESPDPGDWPRQVLSTNPAFVNKDTGEPVCINQIWEDVAKHTPLFESVIPDAPAAVRTVIAPENMTAKYLYTLDDRLRSIDRWDFDVLLRSYHPRLPLTLAASYNANHADAGDNETFATIAKWEGTEDDVVKELTVIAIPKDGKSHDVRTFPQTHPVDSLNPPAEPPMQ